MNKAYFSKVSHTMSWNELKLNISKQKKNDIKPLPYEILIELLYHIFTLNQIKKKSNKPFHLLIHVFIPPMPSPH